MSNTNYADYTYSPVERFELAEGDSIRCNYCYDSGLTDEAEYCTCEAGILETRRAHEQEAQEAGDYRNQIEDSWLDGSYEA